MGHVQTLNTNNFGRSVAADPSSVEPYPFNGTHGESSKTIQRRLRLGTLLELFYGLDSKDQAVQPVDVPSTPGIGMSEGMNLLPGAIPENLPLQSNPFAVPDQHRTEWWDSSSSTFDASLLRSYQHSAHQPPPMATPMPSYVVSPHAPSATLYGSPAHSQGSSYSCFDDFTVQVDPFTNEKWNVGQTSSSPHSSGLGGEEKLATTAFPNWPDFSGCLPISVENQSVPQSWMMERGTLHPNSETSSSTSNRIVSPFSRTQTPFEKGVPLYPTPVPTVYDLSPLQATLSSSPETLPLQLDGTFSPPVSQPGSQSSKSSSNTTSGKMCAHCKATSTPLWRRDPRTYSTLCNACGLYLQQRNKLRPQVLIDADVDAELSSEELAADFSGPECSHCRTHQTSVWRRSKTGEQLCNACGVYLRLRGVERPLSLKRNKIRPRTKHREMPA